jgi:hypothetical protein
MGDISEVLEDEDEGPIVYLALASLLVDQGISDSLIIKRAISIIANREGLERWREAGDEALEERLEVYSALAKKLES